jgi:hypothetical protein
VKVLEKYLEKLTRAKKRREKNVLVNVVVRAKKARRLRLERAGKNTRSLRILKMSFQMSLLFATNRR